MLVSTLRGFVRAMGGDLRLMALFPGEEAVEVSFENLREEAKERPHVGQRRTVSKKVRRSKTPARRKAAA